MAAAGVPTPLREPPTDVPEPTPPRPDREHRAGHPAYGATFDRRAFLTAAAAAAFGTRTFASAHPIARAPRRTVAKRVVYIHLAGSPSNLDLFDYKPALTKYAGQPCPPSLLEGVRFAFQRADAKVLASPYRFARHGASGMWMSELLPNLAGIVDRLTFVRSVHGEQFNHAPAQLLMHTGSPLPGRPALGAWVDYALGTDNPDLPAFVVMLSGGRTPSAGSSLWSSGFLPTIHQGVVLRAGAEPVLFLDDPAGIDRKARARTIETIGALNRLQLQRGRGDVETVTRTAQYELAHRMQRSVPEAVALDREDAATLAFYGVRPGDDSFANNCLRARRLLERGVRFVQLYDWGWDGHGTGKNDDILFQLPRKCDEVDRPITALILDLERRGLLHDTVVVIGGEFGRTPMNEERNGSKFFGRDHHPHCFTMLLAGGGFAAGTSYGRTDDFGFRVIESPVHVHDLQATLLYCLGIDHEELTYRFLGRDFRLTDVGGHVVEGLLA